MDPETGAFDTQGFFYLITPYGEKIEVNNEKIPGFEKLKESIEKCYDYGIEQNNNKTIKFFKKAVDSIKTNVNVLRISDYNTKGLLGSEKENENSPWRNLVNLHHLHARK